MEGTDRIPTPHISAKAGDFADTVLMPGDPLRAKYIADHFLDDARLVTDVRNVYGYTGTYKGKKVSVMASGMGIPSIGIYSYELYAYYGVERIVRIGSAGAISENCKIMDIVLAQGACTTSSWAEMYKLNGTYAPIATWDFLYKTYCTALDLGTKVQVGNVLSADAFYNDDPDAMAGWKKMGILCTEMEAAALYMNAARLGKQALAMFTISDELYSGRELSSYDRQTAFTEMMVLALETNLR
ncbi:MAG TPA: purine-nucleoside phosphorylase [Lachnospiraceae bacterium]|nr:purine-nucleoside phosphorylase [Lachnospiraceae bacterium]